MVSAPGNPVPAPPPSKAFTRVSCCLCPTSGFRDHTKRPAPSTLRLPCGSHSGSLTSGCVGAPSEALIAERAKEMLPGCQLPRAPGYRFSPSGSNALPGIVAHGWLWGQGHGSELPVVLLPGPISREEEDSD